MNIQENTFIKLSDGRTYIVANILEFRGTEYAYLVAAEDEKLYYSFCTESVGKDGKPVLNSVTDKYLVERLHAMFTENMKEKMKKLNIDIDGQKK